VRAIALDIAIGGRLAVVAGQHAHLATGLHGVNRLLDRLEGRGRGNAVVGVAAVHGVSVADGGANRVRLEVGRDHVRAKGHDDVIDVTQERRAPAGADAGVDAVEVGRAAAQVGGHAVAGLPLRVGGLPVVERNGEVLDRLLADAIVVGAADVAHPEVVAEDILRLPGVGRDGAEAVVVRFPDQVAGVVVGRVARRVVVVGEQQAQDGGEVGRRGARRVAVELIRHVRQGGQRPGRNSPRLGEVGLVLAADDRVGREFERAEAAAGVVGGDANGGVGADVGRAPPIRVGRGHDGVGRGRDLRQGQHQQQRQQQGDAAGETETSTHDTYSSPNWESAVGRAPMPRPPAGQPPDGFYRQLGKW